MANPLKTVSVIGAGDCSPDAYQDAKRLGRLLAERGFGIVCGGLGGVMRAACEGASSAGGQAIGILPGHDQREANEFVTTPIATGLSHMRNYLVVLNGLAVVACPGNAGTISEIGLALKIGRPVIVLGGWIDIEGTLQASSPEEAVDMAAKFRG
jgi:hypothetical protein